MAARLKYLNFSQNGRQLIVILIIVTIISYSKIHQNCREFRRGYSKVQYYDPCCLSSLLLIWKSVWITEVIVISTRTTRKSMKYFTKENVITAKNFLHHKPSRRVYWRSWSQTKWCQVLMNILWTSPGHSCNYYVSKDKPRRDKCSRKGKKTWVLSWTKICDSRSMWT